MRNMKKQKEMGRQVIDKHPNADLIVDELTEFKNYFDETARTKGINEAIFQLACDIFYCGVAVGYRTGKKDSTK